MRKWLILFLILILAIFGYNYVYQDHRNIEKEAASFTTDSKSIQIEFSTKPVESEQKYLNKTIEVVGSVTELNKKSITLDETVFCQFESEIDNSIKKGSKLTIKGRVIGYDDLLEEIKLDQCIVIN